MVLDAIRSAARSGHKVGKTELAALLAWWWVATRRDSRAIVTAPTSRQVREGVWRAIRKLHRVAVANGATWLPEPPVVPSTGVNWPDGRQILGFAADHPDNVSGPSGADMLVIVDEAAGVADDVWEAIQSMRAGGGKVLALGNPTQTAGWFFDAFSGGWSDTTISSLESPNITEGRIVIPGLATREWEREIADDYGEESPVYGVRVLGQPPLSGANAVIGIKLLDDARDAFGEDLIVEQPDGLELGCDVARYGDDLSTVAARRGAVLMTPAWLTRHTGHRSAVNGFDAAPVAGIVLAVMRALRRPLERVRIKVDVGGGYGEGVVQVLRAMRDHPDPTQRLDDRVTIVSVNSSERAGNPLKFERRRDELWWSCREFLGSGGMIAIDKADRQAQRELLAPTYGLTPSGKIKIESKDDTKAKLKGRSPDHADACCLATFAAPVTAAAEYDSSYDNDLPNMRI